MKVSPIIQIMKSLNNENKGEIFSSVNLATLAERHYGLRVEVLRPFSSREVIRHLLDGKPFLIPYRSLIPFIFLSLFYLDTHSSFSSFLFLSFFHQHEI